MTERDFIHEKINSINIEIKARYNAPRRWLFGKILYRYQDLDNNLPGGDLVKNEGQISVGLSF